jgi:hypothetical protein
MTCTRPPTWVTSTIEPPKALTHVSDEGAEFGNRSTSAVAVTRAPDVHRLVKVSGAAWRDHHERH